MVVGNEFRVFNNIPRWEVLCIDEGQRREFLDFPLLIASQKRLVPDLDQSEKAQLGASPFAHRDAAKQQH